VCFGSDAVSSVGPRAPAGSRRRAASTTRSRQSAWTVRKPDAGVPSWPRVVLVARPSVPGRVPDHEVRTGPLFFDKILFVIAQPTRDFAYLRAIRTTPFHFRVSTPTEYSSRPAGVYNRRVCAWRFEACGDPPGLLPSVFHRTDARAGIEVRFHERPQPLADRASGCLSMHRSVDDLPRDPGRCR